MLKLYFSPLKDGKQNLLVDLVDEIVNFSRLRRLFIRQANKLTTLLQFSSKFSLKYRFFERAFGVVLSLLFVSNIHILFEIFPRRTEKLNLTKIAASPQLNPGYTNHALIASISFRGYVDELSKRLVCIQLSALINAVGGNTETIGYQRLGQLFGVNVEGDGFVDKMNVLKLDELIVACGWITRNGSGEKVVQISRNANYEVITFIF